MIWITVLYQDWIFYSQASTNKGIFPDDHFDLLVNKASWATPCSLASRAYNFFNVALRDQMSEPICDLKLILDRTKLH